MTADFVDVIIKDVYEDGVFGVIREGSSWQR